MDAAYPEVRDVDVECRIDDCVAIREVNDLIRFIGPAGSIDMDKDRKEMLRRDPELFCKMIMKEVSR